MRAVKDREGQMHEVKLDLLPMIDVTFLIVMFFVLTSAFVTLNLEQVLLPTALQAAEYDPTEEKLLIINIKKTDDSTRDGQIIFDAKPRADTEALKNALKVEADFYKSEHGVEVGPGGVELSKLEVLVRADEGVKGKFLRDVFLACQQVGIYKLKLSALQP